jgi:hypothetical protein
MDGLEIAFLLHYHPALLGEFKTAMNVLAHVERHRSTCPFSYLGP